MKFYALPATREALKKELNALLAFSSLWFSVPTHGDINAPTTLPRPFLSKQQQDKQIASESTSTGASLKIKQGYAYVKSLMGFYKTGVSNVWSNQKQVRALKKSFYMSNYVDKRGNTKNIQLPSFQKLTNEMATHLYIESQEQRSLAEDSVDLVKHLLRAAELTNVFNLSRQQYQLYKRSPSDTRKIPPFAVVVLIIGEYTPFVCYAFPELSPYPCILPNILPRLWNSSSSVRLRDLRVAELAASEKLLLEQMAMRTAHNMPKQQLVDLASSLRLTSRYVPAFVYPKSVLRRRIQHHYNYLVVDNNYLVQHGNIWKLSHQELLMACLERNIILDIKEDIKLQQSLESKGEAYYDELRLKLLAWLVDFPKYNIGYLGLSHVPAVEMERVQNVAQVTNWWKQDNPATERETSN